MNIKILDKLPQLDAGVIRGLGAAFIGLLVSILAPMGFDTENFSKVGQTIIERSGDFLIAVGLAWAYYKRTFSPNPPLTETAVEKTRQMIETGKLTTTTVSVAPPPSTPQGGFAAVSMLLAIVGLGVLGGVVVTLTGCVTSETVTSAQSMSHEAKLKAAIDTAAGVVRLVDTANRRHLVRVEEAEKFSVEAKNMRDILALAETTMYSDPKGSRDLYDFAMRGLENLENYLTSRGATHE